MKKGFTLVELLGVIIVLAIITLITTPVITSIIERAKKEAFKNSTYGLISAGKIYYTEQLVNNEISKVKVFEIVNKNFSGDELSIVGQLPNDGKIAVSADGRVSIAIFNGKYCATKGFDSNEILLFDDLDKNTCLNKVEIKFEYKEIILNGSDPVINEGMIPVIISETGVVTVADLYDKWYEYENKEWANVVLVDSTVRSNLLDGNGVKDHAIGTVIDESNILAYLVWIPRFEYTLWNVNNLGDGYENINGTDIDGQPNKIVVGFQNISNISNGNTVGSTLTHPAFNFGGKQISGFWVGKFETSKNSGVDDAKNPTEIRIKPNVSSWRNASISNMYYSAYEMANSISTFGITTYNNDPHMMKNMEWGAVAYLSHSDYGASSSTNQIRINNSSSYTTGCAASSEDEVSYTLGAPNCQNTWNTEKGYKASTTGNITGIYDMSGGAWEYVMGYSKLGGNTGKNSGFTISDFNNANGFVVYNTNTLGKYSKYIDLYDYTETRIGTNIDTYTNYTAGKLGDATRELGPMISTSFSQYWGDYANFIYSSYPWFRRGGGNGSTIGAGIFSFYYNNGASSDGVSFRITITPIERL